MNAYKIYDEVHIKHLQVVFLRGKGESIKKVCAITGYAKSTIYKYSYEYANLEDEAKQVFSNKCELVYDDEIVLPKGTEQIYLMKFYDTFNNLIFSKIGTTTRSVVTRAKEHINYYTNSGFDLGMVTIDSVEDCKNYPAEMVESFLRFAFIKEFPNTWHKNDRFFGVDIKLENFLKKVQNAIDN